MTDLLRDEEADSLASLEERILKAAELVTQLRRERDAAVAAKQSAFHERDTAVKEAGEARKRAEVLAVELEALRGERRQVRTRIEKLLGQLDLLSAE
jgi:FtsZ-binding cell division protein ZapB